MFMIHVPYASKTMISKTGLVFMGLVKVSFIKGN